MTPLGTAFSRVDALKRQLYDMLTNPRDAAAMLGGRIVESGQQAQALQEQTFGDPNRPFRVTDPQAMARLTDMLMAGPMGFAPAGTISGATRDVIRSSADSLASQLNKLGFQATVQHSGSKAGPSSYVQIYDPETGRMFANPVRFSGHGKGPREAAGVIDIQDPTKDIPNIVQEALQMRSQGPSKVFQKQTIVDDLIAGGMPSRQAYKEADKRVAGLLDQPAQNVIENPLQQAFTTINPGDKVSGLTVRKDVPNMGSIGATFDNYEILEGIRKVPTKAFDREYLDSLNPAKLDKRTADLSDQINQSKEINPLIVAVDNQGAYIVEGGHRFDALMTQKRESVPAVVVIDKDNPPTQDFLRSLLE
jgi:disulfide oxidoreductase YuzD